MAKIQEVNNRNLFQRIFFFYVDGFRNMKEGKVLWAIIFIKLFIMFAILKVFFFPDFLKKEAGNDSEAKSHYVQQELIHRGITPN